MLRVVCVIIVLGTIALFTINNSSTPAFSSINRAFNMVSECNTPGNSSLLNESSGNNSTQCPENPPCLVGPIPVRMDGPSMEQLEALYYKTVGRGGHGKPFDCVSRQKVAVIVPYREREEQMRILLHNLHSLLTKQQLDYGIFIVEQVANQTFNRGKLMNVGYVEALKTYPWECFVFHDVDLLPEDDRNIYSCTTQPRHMSVAVDKMNYRLPYDTLLGGISAMTNEQVEKVNGFSNDYWGWGGEDDDLSKRVTAVGYKIARYPANIARYKMMKHDHESTNRINKCRFKLLMKTNFRWPKDGLSNLNYSILNVTEYPLYINILVDLQYDESQKNLSKILPNC